MAMILKWFISKFYNVSVVIFLSLFSLSINGQGKDKIVDNFNYSKYDKRVQKYRTRWEKLLPTHSKLQFAGNMGFLSQGIGWDYGKNDRWETDVMFGFLPKFDSDCAKITFTLKQNYIPWCFDLGDKFSVAPLTCGMYANTVFGDEFWVKQPDRYPDGYYEISTKIRFNIFLGQHFTYKIDKNRRFLAKQVTFFYELSVSDLHLFSAISNDYLKLKDYLSLSFGLKFKWF